MLLVLMLLRVCGDVGIFLVCSGSDRAVENPTSKPNSGEELR